LRPTGLPLRPVVVRPSETFDQERILGRYVNRVVDRLEGFLVAEVLGYGGIRESIDVLDRGNDGVSLRHQIRGVVDGVLDHERRFDRINEQVLQRNLVASFELLLAVHQDVVGIVPERGSIVVVDAFLPGRSSDHDVAPGVGEIGMSRQDSGSILLEIGLAIPGVEGAVILSFQDQIEQHVLRDEMSASEPIVEVNSGARSSEDDVVSND